ncbi:MAG: arginase [Planctomycetota bacterium]|nr:arginase [Planctomycetota bacterium]
MTNPVEQNPVGGARKVGLLGVPMDLGAGRRGVDMGPSAIRLAGLRRELRELGHEVEDEGDIVVQAPELSPSGAESARYLDSICHVCNRLRMRVQRILENGQFPMVLGGDHSIAMGTVAGVSAHYRNRDEKIGLIWVDAHADMNTPEHSPSGNVHGMPLAALLGQGDSEMVELGGFSPKVDKRNVCLIGIRDLDKKEQAIVAESGIRFYTMRDVDERGIKVITEEALELATDGTAGFHVSFDLDGMDPREVPGTGTPVKGGLRWREGNLLMEMVADSGQLLSLEVVELNPILDIKNQSGEVAVDLILSAMGKRII